MQDSVISPWKAWIAAARPRTLPLAFSCILTGNAAAMIYDRISIPILMLTLLTTLFLQILSNFANDYGDGVKGTDAKRIGPQRMVASGIISPAQMKSAMLITAILALCSGLLLLYLAFPNPFDAENKWILFGFFITGLLAIAAAIMYTVGKNAYGYRGLGDFFVLVFFGFVGVGGSCLLQTRNINAMIILPSLSIGLFSVGVLNLNNMRDRVKDKESGKYTIPVILGAEYALWYHQILIALGMISMIIWCLFKMPLIIGFSACIPVILFIQRMIEVKSIKEDAAFNPLLPKLAMSTFVWSILVFILSIWN